MGRSKSSEYTLTRSQLIKLAGFRGSPNTVARYLSLQVLDSQPDGHRYKYSERTVEELKLIPELRKYAFDQKEMRQTFDKFKDLEELRKQVGKVPPDELYDFVERKGVKLDRRWFYSAGF